MRIGVVGLGGAGNTTMAALVSQAYAASGRRVVAIDTDPYPNLGMCLGVDKDEVEATPPVPRGLGSGVGGRLTAAQLVKTYALETPSGVVVLHAMRAERPGERCSCIGHVNPASSLSLVLTEEAEVTVIDMEAGLEHLRSSNASLAHVDVVLVTMEPTRKSVVAAARSAAVATELGARRVLVVGNKARSLDDRGFLTSSAEDQGLRLAAVVPFELAVLEAGRDGAILPAGSPGLRGVIATIAEAIDEES
jgi:CO dehydrogenase maturation factor